MSELLRRSFLKAGATALPFTGTKLFAAGDRLRTFGVQLYTVREILKQDPAATLKAIDEIGYREAEVTSDSLDQIAGLLKKTKLRPVSLHLDATLFSGVYETKLKAAMDTASEHGFRYAVFPYLRTQDRGDLAGYKKLAKQFNDAGKMAKARGITFCYHNHAFEFGKVGDSTPMTVLLKETDPNLVSLELDVFWVSVAGHDPVEFLKEHSGRVKLMHLKDKDKGQAVQFDERVPKSAFKEVGSGSINFAEVLRAAKGEGVEHYFVEQDQTPGNPIESLRKSYRYLSSLTF